MNRRDAATKEAAVELAKLHEQVITQERMSLERMSSLLSLIDSQAKAASAARQASDLAVSKAEVAVEKRFDAMNEFRAQLADQAGHFATREAVDAKIGAVDKEWQAAVEATRARLNLLERQMERWSGKGTGLATGWGYLAGGISLVILVVNFFFYLASR
jgi:hypothetical protein